MKSNFSFHQRRRLALTHPVTIITLAVLLVNDLVFKAGGGTLCRRFALLLAGVAALAFVGCEIDNGVKSVGTRDDGVVVVGAATGREGGYTWHYLSSNDGGFSWRSDEDAPIGNPDHIPWGGTSVETPRGIYYIDTAGVSLTTGGSTDIVYSTSFLKDAGNEKHQSLATKHLGSRRIARSPGSIDYHEPSGNVIATLGLEGVLVGDSLETWHRVAVGTYSPTDFSIVGKMKLVFSGPWLWVTAVALSISFLAAALMASRATSDWGYAGAIVLSVVAALLSSLAILTLFSDDIVLEVWVVLSVLVMLLGVVALLVFPPHRNHLRPSIGALFGMVALFALAFLFGILQQFNLEAGIVYAVLLLALASVLLGIYLRRSRLYEK